MRTGQDSEAFIGSTNLGRVALQHAFIHCIRSLTLLHCRWTLVPVETERIAACAAQSLGLLVLVCRKSKRQLFIKSTAMAHPATSVWSERPDVCRQRLHGLNCHQSYSCLFSPLNCLQVLVLRTVLGVQLPSLSAVEGDEDAVLSQK